MIRGAATDDTNIIFGATVNERLTGQVWVTVVATGIGRGTRVRKPLFSVTCAEHLWTPSMMRTTGRPVYLRN